MIFFAPTDYIDWLRESAQKILPKSTQSNISAADHVKISDSLSTIISIPIEYMEFELNHSAYESKQVIAG